MTEHACGSCGATLELDDNGRFPVHKGKSARGICGGSELLPFKGVQT